MQTKLSFLCPWALGLLSPWQAWAQPAREPTALGKLNQSQRMASQVVSLNYLTEPDTMDVNRMVAGPSYLWLGHMYEGLMTTDAKGKLVPGQAEKMQVSADGKTYTFTLRSNALWHDGKPVRAQDFVTSWQRLVDPVYASDYSFIAETAQLLNAAEIIRKEKPKESLGVKAQDERTLVVTLRNPAPYFAELTGFQTFFPVRQDLLEKFGDRFATNKESLIGNGPFKMVAWQHEKGMRLEKFQDYWNAKAIKLSAIEAPMAVQDRISELNVFRTGGFDFITLADNSFKQATLEKLQPKSRSSGSITYLEFNTRPGRLFEDVRLRKAIQMGISRREFVSKIYGTPGDKPAFGLIPATLNGSTQGKSFRKEFPMPVEDEKLKEAQNLVQEASQKWHGKSAPNVVYLAGDTPNAKRYSEYFQQKFGNILGLKVNVDSIAFKARQQRQRDGAFDITMYSWQADYADPQSFVELFSTGSGANHTGWTSPIFDDLLARARVSNDNAERMKLFAEAENLVIKKEAIIAPIVENSSAWLEASGLRGVRRPSLGFDPDLRFAYWENRLSTR
jgi:oligopeptide transport system substrate-binding protein